jgi:hypothetical protein
VVFVGDAHMMARSVFYDEPVVFGLGDLDVAVWSLDKHVPGPRDSTIVGRYELWKRQGVANGASCVRTRVSRRAWQASSSVIRRGLPWACLCPRQPGSILRALHQMCTGMETMPKRRVLIRNHMGDATGR